LESVCRHFLVIKDTQSWIVEETELGELIKAESIDSASLLAITVSGHCFDFGVSYGQSELKFEHSP
jgi:hypothetical protein